MMIDNAVEISESRPLVDASSEQRFDQLVREHRAVLMAQSVRLTAGDRAWAEDVVQETFIRAWRHVDKMTADHGSVRAWLLRVAHNVVMDGYRARRARPIEVNEDQLDVALVRDAADQVVASVMVQSALASLNEGQRAVLEQTYLHDLTVADAARELDLPVGTVKSRMFYALRKVRASLAQPACA